jgi:Flp pilus assembly protein TadG
MNLNTKGKVIRRRGERGIALVIMSIGLSAMLLAVGLGIDISHFYMVKTELQHAADGAALAGASALNSSAAGVRAGASRAAVVMNKCEFNHADVTVPTANVTFGINQDDSNYMSQASAEASASNVRFVRVTTSPAPVKVYFASFVLGGTMNITATATAGQSVPLNVFCGYLPISVIDYDVPIMPGNVYTFRAPPSGGPAPGNYNILAVAANGGKAVEFGLAVGVGGCAKADTWYAEDTATGEKAGPMRKGINCRFDDYQGSQLNPIDHPPDTNVKNNITYAQYRDGLSVQAPTHTGVAGRRLVIIPIIKLAEYDQGHNLVKFNRFGIFFLRSKVPLGTGGDLVAEYIQDRVTVSQGDYDPNAGGSNALIVMPVLYK